jgi:hypothetical protein
MVVHTANPTYERGEIKKIACSRLAGAKLQDHISKIKLKNKLKKERKKSAGGMAQVAEDWPSKHKDLDSILTT